MTAREAWAGRTPLHYACQAGSLKVRPHPMILLRTPPTCLSPSRPCIGRANDCAARGGRGTGKRPPENARVTGSSAVRQPKKCWSYLGRMSSVHIFYFQFVNIVWVLLRILKNVPCIQPTAHDGFQRRLWAVSRIPRNAQTVLKHATRKAAWFPPLNARHITQ